MDFELDDGWHVYPMHGNTGAAFMGQKNHQRMFLKRNASPFLAALSMEEITPRLIWTKRISTGDTLTAQEWLNGKTLTKQQMRSPHVAHLLARLHNSKLLHRMLKKVGGQTLTAQNFIQEYYQDLPTDLRSHPLLKATIQTLKQSAPQLTSQDYAVCHGDLNRQNWLLSEKQHLYLVDWDSARFADPASDLGLVMTAYIPVDQWSSWLVEYQADLTPAFKQRVQWYAKMHLLAAIKDNYYRGRYHKMNHDILLLETISA